MKQFLFVFTILFFANNVRGQEVDLGTCKNFAEHIKNCIPINCSFRLPYSNVSSTVQLLIIGEKNNRCYYRQFAQFQSTSLTYAVHVKYDCILSSQGKSEVLQGFENFKVGDDSVYRRNPRDGALKKECRMRD